MAWRSSGRTNDEMVDNLRAYGVIRTPEVEQAFRAVDRRFFVPTNQIDLAHTDQPLREGLIHISAPHIYGTILEALDLTPSNIQTGSTFLNIGSGTGYFTCLVAHMMGPRSTSYSIELHTEALRHCHHAIEQWKRVQYGMNEPLLPCMEFRQGNGLLIDPIQGEAWRGMDRIYVGAALKSNDLQRIANLLRPNGILVCPVDEDLMKVTRITISDTTLPSNQTLSSIPRSLHGHPPPPCPLLNEDFIVEIISNVHFTNMIDPTSTCVPVTLPSRIWQPSLHFYYPPTFRKACKEVLLCANADPLKHTNTLPHLPPTLWLEVFSYTHRDWFVPPPTEEERLRIRLRQMESSLAHMTKQLQVAIRHRNLCCTLVHQMRQRLVSARLDDSIDRSALFLFDEMDGSISHAQIDGHEMDDNDDEEDDDDDDADTDDGDEMEAESVASNILIMETELSSPSRSAVRAYRTVSIESEHT